MVRNEQKRVDENECSTTSHKEQKLMHEECVKYIEKFLGESAEVLESKEKMDCIERRN